MDAQTPVPTSSPCIFVLIVGCGTGFATMSLHYVVVEICRTFARPTPGGLFILASLL